MRIKRLFVIIALLSLMVVVGCAQQASEPGGVTENSSENESVEEIHLRFSWWGGDTRHEATLEAIEIYMEQNPHVKISGEYGGFDGYFTKLTTQLVGNTAPDIIQVDQPVMGDLTSRGDFFVDLREYEAILDISGFDTRFLEDYSYYNGKLVGLPTGVNANNIIVNTKVAEAVGIDLSVPYTWDKVFEDAKKIRDYDKEMYLFNIGKNPIRYHVLVPYLSQILGGQFIQDDYTFGFTREQLIDAYTLIRRIYEEGVTEPASQSKPFEAFYETNPKWINHQYLGMLHEASITGPEYYNFPEHAAVMLPPIREDAKDSGIVIKPSQLIVINKNSAHVEEAIKFLDFFFNSEDALHALKGVRGVPATELGRKIADENGYVDPLSVQTIEMAMERPGIPVNDISNNSEVIAIQYDAIDKLAFGAGTVEEIADESIRHLENFLSSMKANAE